MQPLGFCSEGHRQSGSLFFFCDIAGFGEGGGFRLRNFAFEVSSQLGGGSFEVLRVSADQE